ncbi:MAG: phytanoyl-CoA dioxygenase family protein [Pseudomonadota bacterium]
MPASYLLADSTGHYLRADGAPNRRVGDDGLWQPVDEAARRYRNVGHPECVIAAAADVRVAPGPTRAPSAYLAELRATGLTILDNVLDAAEISTVRDQVDAQRSLQQPRHLDGRDDGRVMLTESLSWSLELARAAVHPVAHWIFEAFLESRELHFCHYPSVTIMRPASDVAGTYPAHGWHSDYPYHPGLFPDEHWPAAPAFGVQFNLCIDAFRPDNAATQYLPGSHLRRHWPPPEFSADGTRMGQGQHERVTQMVAPAGAALIYDARLWHRACDELNTSGEDRLAMLNAVAPAWVPLLAHKTAGNRAYLASAVPDQLTARERADVERLCVAPVAARPQGMPALVNPRLEAEEAEGLGG